MRFLQTYPRGPGSAYEILSIEGELERRGFLPVAHPAGRGHALQRAVRLAGKLRLDTLLYPLSDEPVVVVHGGLPPIFPLGLWTRFIPYSFDCWRAEWSRWESFYRRNRMRLAFLTARQCVEHFQLRMPDRSFSWLPECVDPEIYDRGGPLVERSIDVLELGRRFDSFHAAIAPLLKQHLHLYEKPKGRIIFPAREALIDAYANSRISVCFSSSVSHPERSGSIETLTLRYLESMASRTLIVGSCPDELLDLFGYNPVIELSDPREVLDLLGTIAAYQPLVDRNYRRLLEVGTHTVRVEQLIATLRAHGYAAPPR